MNFVDLPLDMPEDIICDFGLFYAKECAESGKGVGGFASHTLEPGQVLCEYYGQKISETTADKRDLKYQLEGRSMTLVQYCDKPKKRFFDGQRNARGVLFGRLGNPANLLNHTREKHKQNVELIGRGKGEATRMFLRVKHGIEPVKPHTELLYEYGDFESKDAFLNS